MRGGAAEPFSLEEQQELVVQYMGLRFRRQVRGHAILSDDLLADMNLGLVKAARSFDPAQGASFATWAQYWLKNARIENYVQSLGGQVRVGTSCWQRKIIFRLAKAESFFTDDMSEDEVKEKERALKVDRDTTEQFERFLKTWDTPIDTTLEGHRSLVDILAEPGGLLDDVLGDAQEKAKTRGALLKAIMTLDEREQKIIKKRFLRETPMTLLDLGDDFGVSRERVRQLEMRAIAKLKKALTGEDVAINSRERLGTPWRKPCRAYRKKAT